MKRFLFNFSYIGNKYSGVAKQANSGLTVINVIEKCIQELKPVTLVSKTNLSSRTDAGVHAVSNTMHADLNINYDYFRTSSSCDAILANHDDKENFICNYLKSSINDLIVKKNHLIRSRNASSRTYVYRLAFYNHDRLLNLKMNQAKPEKVKPAHKNLYYSFAYYQNVIENDFLIEIREPFDKSKFIKKIHPERPNPFHEYTNKHENNYSIMELEITAESFLYKMIRKMIGAAVDVGRNKMSLEAISEMMTCPADFYNQDSIVILKPNGLFLKNVEYSASISKE